MSKRMSVTKNRNSYIGGSDVGSIMKMNKYCSPLELWEEKTGKKQPFEGNAITELGSYLEKFIAKKYAERNGVKVRERYVTFEGSESFLKAHIDREILTRSDKKGIGILEVKALGNFVFRKAIKEGLPAMYMLQLQYYLMITSKSWGAFAVMNRDNGEMLSFDVDADEDLQKKILQSCKNFWRSVKNDTPPVTAKSDLGEIRTEEMQGEERDALRPADQKKWIDAIHNYNTAKDAEKEMKGFKADSVAILSKLMGESSLCLVDGFKVSYKPTKRTTFDKKKLEKELPGVFEKYSGSFTTKPAIRVYTHK